MVGNDIVDLTLAKTQSNWQRKGFLEKQFTQLEIGKILSSINPFFMVWLFWSMKEAAYKCYVQQTEKRFFNPKRFQCKIQNRTKGTVSIANATFFTSSVFTTEFIHTIATSKLNTKIKSAKIYIQNKNRQSKEVQHALMHQFDGNAILRKNKIGIPKIYLNNQKSSASISMSHHGNFGAYSIES